MGTELFMQMDGHIVMNVTKKIIRNVSQEPTVDRSHTNDDFY